VAELLLLLLLLQPAAAAAAAPARLPADKRLGRGFSVKRSFINSSS